MATTTWSSTPRRSDVLRTVLDRLEERQDGRLPVDLPGVADTFGDDLALIGALQLRWHTRLSGAIERGLSEQPFDPAGAVVDAWAELAASAPGLRRLLDARRESPATSPEADALARATAKERTMLAAMAGMESPSSPEAASTGAALELLARGQAAPTPTGRHRAEPEGAGRGRPGDADTDAPDRSGDTGHPGSRLVSRLKAALAA